MTRYYVIVDDTTNFPLFNWGPSDNEVLSIASGDLASIKAAFTSFNHISIVDENDLEVAAMNQYDTYTSINYRGRQYSNQLDGFNENTIVTLNKVDLVEQVQRLDEQVNKIVDIDGMTLEEYKEWKIGQFSEMGEQLIFAGTEVTLLNGVVKNFTYNLEDQSNLLNAIFIIQALGDLTISIPYHGHAEPCELYNARDILSIYFTLQFFSTRIQTEVNMKMNWIRACETKEEAMAINFNDELPTEWAERAEAIIGPTIELAEQLQAQYFGNVEPVVGEEE
jgi:hypothetical protein